METVEESLNDTAHLLSALVEEKLSKQLITEVSYSFICKNTLSPIFENTKARSFEAKIYGHTKIDTDLQAYITDKNGIVVFDSEIYREGLDYSKFNDVYLTLKGKYGARSSKLIDSEGEGGLFVAAPIKHHNIIIGVLTVIKPKVGVVPFIDLAKEKFWRISLIVGLSIAFVFSLLAYLMFRPISKLSSYVVALRNKTKMVFPKIGLLELENLGKEIDRLVIELEGKEYIENYVQTLTHEIKSPLSSILASAELLENNPQKKEVLIENINKEGKRIQLIIEQMLSLSALEGMRSIQKSEDIDLLDLSQEILSSFKIEIQSKNLSVNISGSALNVKGDRQQIQLAVRNLLRNSLEFSKSGDQINISIFKNEEKKTVVEIEDEGVNIPEYAIDKIMERFFSLPRPDTKQKSSGLGLSIVKQIASLHGAQFQIKNRETSGVQATLLFKD